MMDDQLHLVARVGATWVALPTDAISSVVRVEKLIPVPSAPPAVMGLVTIRSRIVTCIDAAAIVGESSGVAPFMAIVSIDGHGYGIALDEVDDVVALSGRSAIGSSLSPLWAALDPLLADSDGHALLVIEPSRIVAAASKAQSAAA